MDSKHNEASSLARLRELKCKHDCHYLWSVHCSVNRAQDQRAAMDELRNTTLESVPPLRNVHDRYIFHGSCHQCPVPDSDEGVIGCLKCCWCDPQNTVDRSEPLSRLEQARVACVAYVIRVVTRLVKPLR